LQNDNTGKSDAGDISVDFKRRTGYSYAMDILGVDAKAGIQDLMVGPLNILHDLLAVIIPGMAFLALLWAQGVVDVPSIMGRQIFGYKTTICLMLILSYIMGKLLIAPVFALIILLKGLSAAAKRLSNTQEQSTGSPFEQWVNKHPEPFRSFVNGVLTSPLHLSEKGFLHILSVMQAEMGFYATMACAFLAASVTPSPRHFRVAEITMSGLLFIASVARLRSLESASATFLGSATADMIGRMSSEDRKAFKDAAVVLAKIVSPPTVAPVVPPPATG
jgi:hypothetical protein